MSIAWLAMSGLAEPLRMLVAREMTDFSCKFSQVGGLVALDCRSCDEDGLVAADVPACVVGSQKQSPENGIMSKHVQQKCPAIAW